MGGGGELAVGFRPFTVEQRGDRQRRRHAIADELREGIALLEGQLLRRVHLVGAAIHVALRPDTAGAPAGLVVEGEHRRVEVGQRVKIDEAG